MRATSNAILAAVLLAACGAVEEGSEGEPAARAPAPSDERSAPAPQGDPWTEIRNVDMRVFEGVVMEVRSLRGRLRRTTERPAYFDRPASFAIEVDDAEVAMSGESLAGLMNGYVFAYEGAPLQGIEVEVLDGRIRQKGTLAKAVPVPFEIEAEPSVTEEGKIRLVPTSIEAAGIGVTGLMDLLDLEMAEVIETEEARGLRIEGNEIFLDPERMTPPPRIRGRVRELGTEGGKLLLRLGAADGAEGPGEPLTPSDPEAPNFLYFQSGFLRFGKLTMRDTDLQIVDGDPSDPFDFFLARLDEQLAAGTSRTMLDAGLLTRMPDYAEIERRGSPPGPGADR